MGFRIGFGYDVHQLAEGEDLVIGGITIPHVKGTVGHSDADVLLHAICDAILGAQALGDIGKHFPDTSDEYKGIDSKLLLEQVVGMTGDNGYGITNIDSTVALQQPKLAPHIDTMRETIASITGLDISAVSIKATTTEKRGFVGREEGVEAYAVVLLHAT